MLGNVKSSRLCRPAERVHRPHCREGEEEHGQPEPERGEQAVARRVTRLGEDGGGVERHDVDTRELLGDDDDGAGKHRATQTGDSKELPGALGKRFAAEGVLFFHHLAVRIVLSFVSLRPVIRGR